MNTLSGANSLNNYNHNNNNTIEEMTHRKVGLTWQQAVSQAVHKNCTCLHDSRSIYIIEYLLQQLLLLIQLRFEWVIDTIALLLYYGAIKPSHYVQSTNFFTIEKWQKTVLTQYCNQNDIQYGTCEHCFVRKQRKMFVARNE